MAIHDYNYEIPLPIRSNMNSNYRPEIDGLRAIAVTAVILFHADFKIFAGGFVGVDVFFVISGFLITTLVRKHILTNTFSIKEFFYRRLRRIFPQLFLVILATALPAWFLLLPQEFKLYSGSVFGNLIFLANFFFMTQVEYFAPSSKLQPLLHTWSLSIEEQYYLILPFFLLFFGRWSKLPVALLVLFISVSFYYTVLGVTEDPGKNYFHSISRFWQLAIGSLLAFTNKSGDTLASTILAFLGISLVLFSALFIDNSLSYPNITALFPVTGAVLYLQFSNAQTGVGKILSNKIFVQIGLLSYALYLWHQPIFVFARAIIPNDLTIFQKLVLVLLTFLISYTTWRFVEWPIRKQTGWAKVSPKTTVSVWLVVSLTAGTAGIIGYYDNGFEKLRDPRSSISLASSQLKPNTGLFHNCAQNIEACTTEKQPKTILWGDSYAMHIAEALLERTPKISLQQKTFPSCVPMLNYSMNVTGLSPKAAEAINKRCFSFNDETYEYIISSSHIKNVILASQFPLHKQFTYSRAGKALRGNQQENIFKLEFMNLIEKLTENGKKVFVVLPPAETGTDLGRCGAKVLTFGYDKEVCNFDLRDARNTIVKTLFESMSVNATLIDLNSSLCTGGICQVLDFDRILYLDEGHLTLAGAKYVRNSFPEHLPLVD